MLVHPGPQARRRRARVPLTPAWRWRVLAAVLLTACAPVRRVAGQRPAPAPPPIVLPLTQTRVLHSAINGREYHLAVALPLGYGAGGATDTTRYPVLYVLDGGAHLPLLASMFRLTNRSGPAGDVILVGIGYYPPGALPRPVAGQTPARNVDYSPPRYPETARPETAGAKAAGAAPRGPPPLPWAAEAPAFLRVLKGEIIPLVERAYRTTAARALHGHSLGGLFATYVLFEDPDLFDRYAIMSPSYRWDGGSIFAREAAFRTRRDALPKQVFLGVGELEGPDPIAGLWRMVGALCAGRSAGSYRGLRLAAEVIPDEHHGSAALFGRSLKALYPAYPSPAAPADACLSR